ncbi:MAG: OmpA family protein [Myxococcales bacterium]|nr:OmpA family protein [Myxococcales bacterium]
MRPNRCIPLLAFAFVVLLAFPARAQHTPAFPFPSNLFEPAPGARDFPMTESPEVGEDLRPNLGFYLSYQYRTFAVMGCSGTTCGDDVSVSQTERTIDLVKHVLVSDLLASFNFLSRFQFGLAVPLYIWQTGRHSTLVTDAQSGASWLVSDSNAYQTMGVLGDIRLYLKARVVGRENRDGFALSVGVAASLPMTAWTGQGENYNGAAHFSVTAPQIAMGYRVGHLHIAANLGALWREKQQFYSAVVGHALKYAGAVSYEFPLRADAFGLTLFGELYGQKSLASENFNDLDSAPLLFNGGVRINTRNVAITAGAGGGIISAPGVPQVQGIFGFSWHPKPPPPEYNPMITEWDRDGDGIPNEYDLCPDEPEDYDGFEDEDGCPEPDNDGDGIPDGYDLCPNDPEDFDGFRDDDGCPDLDHDEDGILDPYDMCPDEPEDYDGFEDEDGCPEYDNDGDGIPDAQDLCPNDPEDFDGFEDEDGCPDHDNDFDGVPDYLDMCPDEPETWNGRTDYDGCPDRGAALFKIEPERFNLIAGLNFKTKSAEFNNRDSTVQILDMIAWIAVRNPILRYEVVAHTDSTGKAETNRTLTENRAANIKAYLVSKGVAEGRISVEGMGDTQPIESNARTSGRKANNRVDIRIIRPNLAPRPAVDEDVMDFTDDDDFGDTMDFTDDDDGDVMDFTE